MCKCLISGEELPSPHINFVGYECRTAGRYTCPNFMHHMVNGKNCRLMQNNKMNFARLSLADTKAPYKEIYNSKSNEELKEMHAELKIKYEDSFEPKSNVFLRAQLGAIEELLAERENTTRTKCSG